VRVSEALKKQRIGRIWISWKSAGLKQGGSSSQHYRNAIASVITLVHKVDISRLAYVRGKTVKHLCGGGYDSLEKIATRPVRDGREDGCLL